jgi:excinuclease ABC subunit C
MRDILKGDLNSVIRHYQEQIREKVKELAFEEAEIIKHKLKHLQEYRSSSMVVSEKTGTVDVFSILEENDTAYVNHLAVNNGAVIFTQTITLQKKLEETPAEVLAFAIAQIRNAHPGGATEFIVPFPIPFHDPNIRITVPRAGVKKKLLELSLKNVNHFAGELRQKKLLLLEEKTGEETMEVLRQLKEDLHLQQVPLHIECFDNSNFQGSFPVSALVCFKNGVPSKSDYRKFNVKTVKGPDDFATMSEVVYRRYHRLLKEDQPLPNLVIIDGGKGQLNAAMESVMRLGLAGRMTFVGIAKNEEELFFVGDRDPVRLPWNSESLRLIRRIRDEVHRFGIGFHRNQRSRGAIRNELEDIPGIGKQTAELLMKKFRSVANIKKASATELESIVGKAKTEIVRAYWGSEGLDKKKGPG